MKIVSKVIIVCITVLFIAPLSHAIKITLNNNNTGHASSVIKTNNTIILTYNQPAKWIIRQAKKGDILVKGNNKQIPNNFGVRKIIKIVKTDKAITIYTKPMIYSVAGSVSTSDALKTVKEVKTQANAFTKQYNQFQKLKIHKSALSNRNIKIKNNKKVAKPVSANHKSVIGHLTSTVHPIQLQTVFHKKQKRYHRHHKQQKQRLSLLPDYYIPPEKPTVVRMSASDVNRIVCPDTIKDIVFSKEKGARVSFEGRNAYIKFLMQKNPLTGKIKYNKSPNEFYITCDNTVYTVIAIPSQIETRIIRLMGNNKKNIIANQRIFAQLPYEKKIVKITKSVYKDNIPDTWEISKKHIEYTINGLNVILKRTIKIVGTGFTAKEFIVKTGNNIKSYPLNERMFLSPKIAKDAAAISLTGLHLDKKHSVRLIIISVKGVRNGY